MLGAMEGVLLSVATSEALLGIVGNTFIALVNCMDCTRNKNLYNIGFILTGLAISRICLVWILITEAYIKIFSPQLLSPINIIELISYLWIITSQLNVWFATSLSIFYFLKIANFSHHIFLWLKRRINIVFAFLIGCLLMSWLFSFPVVVKMVKDKKMLYINSSWQIHMKKSELIINYVFTNGGVFLLFIIMLIVCFLLIISLWRHSKWMQSNESGFRDLNTEVHVKTIKVLLSFIILFILHLIGITINVICLLVPENNLLFVFGLTIAFLYPCCHSLILILANSRLKRCFVRILQQLMCSEEGKEFRNT
ncbi:taste receptor type 2 member 114 [Rattus norvegicus]|uniref:Taste receptor type 2 member 114 n=1 Tax=Rattus norvegicus TaxID=10116 RepID=TR114_RAT|nr:taste receptor type 2 member 114 [Rattus norvegicus]Q9JKT8.1 RecName: Full=Taste receptor type 2 member 114; Short=T2R114; AltName: Full=Taste receptor type 2 member 5; Short=T2R5 [Rattus norvegicus]AAF43916.1 candidate taste receptor T2R5 [Rattus norvegicus]|eukprot:NP_076486.1 taste receptor type 2 member 114 [Rattus norvegicus]